MSQFYRGFNIDVLIVYVGSHPGCTAYAARKALMVARGMDVSDMSSPDRRLKYAAYLFYNREPQYFENRAPHDPKRAFPPGRFYLTQLGEDRLWAAKTRLRQWADYQRELDDDDPIDDL